MMRRRGILRRRPGAGDRGDWVSFLRFLNPRRKRPPGGHLMPEPVEPNPNRGLSGGAEAPLEFDD